MIQRSAALLALLAALFLGLAASHPQQNAASARFALGGNAAQVPAQFVGDLVFLPVSINQGKPSLFLLDSSAAASSVDPDRAAQLGLAPAQPAELDLTGVAVPVPALPAIARKDFGAQVGHEFEGALGGDFLSAVVVKIDYQRRTLQLYDPRAFQYAGLGAVLPLTFGGGAPSIRTKFTIPRSKPVEADFIVNTALDASVVISERFAESHRLFSAPEATIPADDPLSPGGKAVLGRLKVFELGPYATDSPIAVFSQATSPAGGSRLAGEIGAGMLRRFTVTFDYPHQRIILEPNSHIEEEDEEDKSGLAIVANGPGLKSFEVVGVEPGSPAADAGIQKGDIIAGVDGEAAADMSLAEVRELFRDIGHKYTLLIERNGQTLTVEMKTRRLL
jgi:PDZ domain